MGANSKNLITSRIDQTISIGLIAQNSIGRRINLTDANAILQIAFVNLTSSDLVTAHSHLKIARNTIGTHEVWIVLKGKAIVYFYDLDGSLITTAKIAKGDVVILIEGGHSLQSKSRRFSMIEVKNGPYLGRLYDSISIPQ